MTATRAAPTATPITQPVAIGIKPGLNGCRSPCADVLAGSAAAIKQRSALACFAPLEPGEKLEQARLRRRQAFAPAWAAPCPSSGSRGSLLDRVEQRRVDIGLAAHRRRVAERLGDRLDHRLDADPRVLGLLQHLLESDDARAPGPEMLGGEVAASRLADIIVDVARGDRVRLAVAVDILEQHLAGQLLAALARSA